ncbi:nitrogen regulation protein NR(II) [Marinimicrobium sp. ABcell2]|uniref:nitrogen regulation protein NR(II) n=1 Tax=Marinimicrobium sp. ABcell2 TaxID=3069751 RepID=UPI0027B045B5|nr:nitrogen regulation protein NR(II) [Marinimicrobium sp. ABcell2]MDQ2076032.1 nitrogen regulation protein NR(II) [Marinimicrobium sp. ABcell2]
MSPRELHKPLLDSLNTAVILVDNELHLRHMNPAAEALLGISSERSRGEPLTAFFYESDETEHQLMLAAAQANHYTKRHAEWQLFTGGQITVDYTVTPFNEDSGLIIEIQSIDRLLRISREELLAASQETTRNLVRGMAHEIKNPLGGIRGAAQLLARELPDSGLQEYTGVIIDEADRLRNLVDRMLGPNQLPQLQPLNIHEALERVATIIKAESSGAVRLVRDYDPSIPLLSADKEHLIQALLNIARNAMQAMLEAGTESPQLRLRTRIVRRYTIGRRNHALVCLVDIVDNGPGIPSDIIANIFYPMISGRADGTGLGLTISQHLIHQHHGLIECHSEPGETRFSLYLPMEAQ